MKKEVITATAMILFSILFIAGCAGPDQGVLTGSSVSDAENDGGCAANICYDNSEEVYCPEDISECELQYDYCRTIRCASEEAEATAEEYADYYAERETEYEYTTSDIEESSCDEMYNDCYDDGQPITCKGPFELCDEAFDDCVCGSEEDVVDEAEPEFDSGEAPDCDTGVYICKKYSLSMDGTPATSKVTCKSSWVRCSATYGKCVCGNSSLVDFGTQTVGDAGGEGSADYNCEFEGRTFPCYMVVDNPKLCSKSSHTCKSDDRWIQCEGSMPYCVDKFDNKCVCGVENLGYGEYNTEG